MHIWITLIVLFLVELGASIMVSSTNVPCVIITPLSDNNWLMSFNNLAREFLFFQQVPKVHDGGKVWNRLIE
ncbi:hypothetical protein VCSRO3_2377 [Vibrio cholerae]|nr:hypothetical protein VCSRO3_2377 [Vibrio cholerae]